MTMSMWSETIIPGQKYRFEEVSLCLRTQTGLRSYKLLHVAGQTLRNEDKKQSSTTSSNHITDFDIS